MPVKKNQGKTPITEDSYPAFQAVCGHAVAEKATNPRQLAFGLCMCEAATANLRVVIAKHNVKFEEDITDEYWNEVQPSEDQIAVCKAAATKGN